MGKIERAIKALEALPPDRSEEIAELAPGSALTEEQRNEVRRRRASGFQPADPLAIDRLIESFK